MDKCKLEIGKYMNDGSDRLIAQVVINKFDTDTRVAWERNRKALALSCDQKASNGSSLTFLPDWQAVKLFLQDEADLHLQYRSGAFGITPECDDAFQAEILCESDANRSKGAQASNLKHVAKVNSHCN